MIKGFFKENGLNLSINVLFFMIIFGVFMYLRIPLVIILLTWFIWFLPLLAYMVLNYIKWSRYINNIRRVLEELDKKYLLPEVIDEPNFLLGEEINDVLRELSKNMHENVKHYRTEQEEYREYIEMWIHEIKTPIASSRLVIENNYNDVTRKIDYQIDRIDNFIEQVLYYTRSDEVSKDYIIKELELDSIVKKVVKKNYRDFISKKIKLEIEEIKETIYSDSKWVEFIVNQILVNSVKYTKEKEGVIKISANSQGNSVVLIIEDNGVGIIERDLDRIFEKGFTGENGRRFGKSTGIGLYLCKRLCDKLGLGLKLESKLNKGTKVRIIFPKDKVMKIYT
ncbi:histidine kinase-, DNA gyrase B-, and HSP90-like ATPase family protein [Clostridium butyricum]|nr:histidine kinase-, DNA gyrase B-, and HSP90-like ATPase family protein [Clostridium butyricum]